LNSLVGNQGVVAAMLATDDGDLLAVAPTSTDASEAQATAEWASEQIERMSGLRNHVGESEFSLLVDEKQSPVHAHCHLQSMRGHILLVFFSDRDFLGRIRRACRETSSQLERFLLES
jgi:hypothetical protein